MECRMLLQGRLSEKQLDEQIRERFIFADVFPTLQLIV